MLWFPVLSGPTKSRKVAESYRPRVLELEERSCPTAHITLNAQVLSGHMVQLSGTVTDSGSVSGYHVMLSGAASGNVTTDANGNYSYTCSSASLGAVYANGMNDSLQSTDSAQANITVAAPSVTLAISYGAQRNVTLSGQLTNIDHAGQTVHISGVSQGNVVTDSSGHFSLTTTASALGEIDATETDQWGQASNTASVTAADGAPVIQNFTATQTGSNQWTFAGTVIDSNAEGLTVRFGGLMALGGLTATVHADGTFSLTCTVGSIDIGGNASAITTDWWGLDSNTALAAVNA